jgi:hypothetical protein
MLSLLLLLLLFSGMAGDEKALNSKTPFVDLRAVCLSTPKSEKHRFKVTTTGKA